MKSLEKVQKWMKAAKIICKIVLILMCVAAALCLVCALGGNAVSGVIASIGDTNVIGLTGLEEVASVNITAVCVMVIVSCAFSILLMALAIRYLNRELKDGTPFTQEFANNMKKLAINSLVLPAVSALCVWLLKGAYSLGGDLQIKFDILTALLLFAFAAVCRYGADVLNRGEENAEN